MVTIFNDSEEYVFFYVFFCRYVLGKLQEFFFSSTTTNVDSEKFSDLVQVYCFQFIFDCGD